MKFHIRQNFAHTKPPIYITITLLILSSTLTSQIPAAMVVKAVDGDDGDDDLASSQPSTAGKYSGESLDSQLATVLNSNTSTPCLNAAIQSISSNDFNEDDDKDDNNELMNVLDGDSETEWSAGDLGSFLQVDLGDVFLQVDLGDVKKICSVDASWSDGDEKSNNFVVSVSKDGTTFEDVLRGSSSGTTESKEHYELSPSDGRYLRITFYGDSENDEEVTIRELTVNTRSADEIPTTASGGSGEGIPFIRDPQSTPPTNASNVTKGNEPSVHNAPVVSDIHAMVTSAASFEIILNGSDSDLID
ncbi:MAG: discoidin domain-containing protein, partial [Nitrososphaeraceae archaeon]